MRLVELANTLPNGFHDAAIRNIAVDYEQGCLSLTMSIKVGDPDADKDHCDDCRQGRVQVDGLIFCVIDPPGTLDRLGQVGELWISDCFESRSIPQFTKHLDTLMNGISGDAFVDSFFVNDWNSYIHVAGRNCSLTWLGEAHSYRGRRQAFYPGETIDPS